MFNHIFVAYLEDRNILTPEQAIDALETQKDTKIRIGTLAVEENLMTPEQADTLNRQQTEKNMRFGELAIKAGYLTQEQLARLLDKQPRDYVILKQILIDKQYMAAGTIDTALADFKGELGFNNDDFENLLDNDVNTYVSKIAAIDGEAYPLLKEFSTLFISAIIRLIDKEVLVGKAVKVSIDAIPYTVSVKLVGDLSNVLVFSAGGVSNAIDFAGKFAEGFMGMSIDATDEIAQDAMKEFTNCVGGLLATELSDDEHLKADIEVPVFYDKLPVKDEITMVPLTILNHDELKIFIM